MLYESLNPLSLGFRIRHAVPRTLGIGVKMAKFTGTGVPNWVSRTLSQPKFLYI